MHILFVTSYYPSQEAPITGSFFDDQARALHKAGHKIGVLVTPRLSVTRAFVQRNGLGTLRSTLREDDYYPDFPVYRMHWGWFPRVLPFMVKALLSSAGVRAFEQYIREQGMPDIIHAHNIFYGGYLTLVLSKKFNIPFVLTEYSSSYLEGLIIFPGQAGIIRNTLRASKANLVCGSSLIKPLQTYAPEQQEIETIGCIVDTDFFNLSNQPHLEARPFKFLMIAQLKERRKAHDVLVKAFAQAFKGQNDVTLTIRGSGPLRQGIDELIAELGVGAQIQFLPLMPREAVRDLIHQSHSLVSSSYVETFAVGVAEAIACGVPVVSTISGGPEDYVTKRSGILVPAGDITAFAEAMSRMVDEYDNFNPKDVRADVVKRFSEEAYVRRLEAIYSSALNA